MNIFSPRYFTIQKFFKNAVERKAIKKEDIKEIKKLAGDASSRIYYRLKTSSQSYILCFEEKKIL